MRAYARLNFGFVVSHLCFLHTRALFANLSNAEVALSNSLAGLYVMVETLERYHADPLRRHHVFAVGSANLMERDALDSSSGQSGWAGAHTFAKLAVLTYPNQQEIMKGVSLRGWSAHEKYETNDGKDGKDFVQAYRRDRACAFAFRGSDDSEDWKNNLDSGNTVLPGTSWRVHKGFLKEWEKLKPFIQAIRAKLSCSELFFTGHSMGGAVATLAFLEFGGSAYTFGGPQTMHRESAQCVDNYYRLFNNRDLVTMNIPIFKDIVHMGGPGRSTDCSQWDHCRCVGSMTYGHAGSGRWSAPVHVNGVVKCLHTSTWHIGWSRRRRTETFGSNPAPWKWKTCRCQWGGTTGQTGAKMIECNGAVSNLDCQGGWQVTDVPCDAAASNILSLDAIKGRYHNSRRIYSDNAKQLDPFSSSAASLAKISDADKDGDELPAGNLVEQETKGETSHDNDASDKDNIATTQRIAKHDARLQARLADRSDAPTDFDDSTRYVDITPLGGVSDSSGLMRRG